MTRDRWQYLRPIKRSFDGKSKVSATPGFGAPQTLRTQYQENSRSLSASTASPRNAPQCEQYNSTCTMTRVSRISTLHFTSMCSRLAQFRHGKDASSFVAIATSIGTSSACTHSLDRLQTRRSTWLQCMCRETSSPAHSLAASTAPCLFICMSKWRK